MFLASLTKVNTEIALYVFGSMDVSNNLAPSAFGPEREDALGAEMMWLGQTLRDRAADRLRTVDRTVNPHDDPR